MCIFLPCQTNPYYFLYKNFSFVGQVIFETSYEYLQMYEVRFSIGVFVFENHCAQVNPFSPIFEDYVYCNVSESASTLKIQDIIISRQFSDPLNS